MKKLFNDDDVVWVVNPGVTTFETLYKYAQRERQRLQKKYNAVFAIVKAGTGDDAVWEQIMKIHDRNIAKCTAAVKKFEQQFNNEMEAK